MPIPRAQREQAAALAPERLPRRPAEQAAVAGRALSRAGDQPAADVAAHGDQAGAHDQERQRPPPGAGGRRTGAREGAHLLRPAERRPPAQPVERPRGVSHHPQQQRHDEHARRQLAGRAGGSPRAGSPALRRRRRPATAETMASARYAEPPAERPPATSPASVASQSSAAPAAMAARAARYAARRLTMPASTISCRPASSSPRRARAAASTAQTAAKMSRTPPTRQAT